MQNLPPGVAGFTGTAHRFSMVQIFTMLCKAEQRLVCRQCYYLCAKMTHLGLPCLRKESEGIAEIS